MLNGQRKQAYNVQIAVEDYFIIYGYVSNDCTDYNTRIPVLEKHKRGIIYPVILSCGIMKNEKHVPMQKRSENITT